MELDRHSGGAGESSPRPGRLPEESGEALERVCRTGQCPGVATATDAGYAKRRNAGICRSASPSRSGGYSASALAGSRPSLFRFHPRTQLPRHIAGWSSEVLLGDVLCRLDVPQDDAERSVIRSSGSPWNAPSSSFPTAWEL